MYPYGSIYSNSSFAQPRSFDYEKIEIDSICCALGLDVNEAYASLQNLKLFLNINDHLSFRILKGGSCNAPIVISRISYSQVIPIAVLKLEPKREWALLRLKALEEMRENEFYEIPNIFISSSGEYLVQLGDDFYSCMEYIEPDENSSLTFENMVSLTRRFHMYSYSCLTEQALTLRTLDTHSTLNILQLTQELYRWNPSIFFSDSWDICVKCAQFFNTPTFRHIYDRLPTQIIHGDLTPNNVVVSKGHSYLVDFEMLRTDIRLLDFAFFTGWSFLDRYIDLIKNDQFGLTLQFCYGSLEDIEKQYFHLIVMFGRCGVLDWALSELKQALYENDLEKQQKFQGIVERTIHEINTIYNAIPELRDMLHHE